MAKMLACPQWFTLEQSLLSSADRVRGLPRTSPCCPSKDASQQHAAVCDCQLSKQEPSMMQASGWQSPTQDQSAVLEQLGSSFEAEDQCHLREKKEKKLMSLLSCDNVIRCLHPNLHNWTKLQGSSTLYAAKLNSTVPDSWGGGSWFLYCV